MKSDLSISYLNILSKIKSLYLLIVRVKIQNTEEIQCMALSCMAYLLQIDWK